MENYLNAVPFHYATPTAIAQQDHLYSCLTIIDNKSQAMLSFNSFMLATVGIYVGVFEAVQNNPVLTAPFVVTLLASGVSCLLCLDVIWVHWLAKNDMVPKQRDSGPEADAPTGIEQVGEGFLELLQLRDERTRTYRLAWLLSFTSVGFIMLGIISTLLVGWFA